RAFSLGVYFEFASRLFASGNERSGPLWSLIPDIHAAKELARNDSDSAQQNQDQQDNNYEAQSTATVIAGPIKWAAANAAKTTQQGDHQNNQNNRTNRHGLSPFRVCRSSKTSQCWNFCSNA